MLSSSPPLRLGPSGSLSRLLFLSNTRGPLRSRDQQLVSPFSLALSLRFRRLLRSGMLARLEDAQSLEVMLLDTDGQNLMALDAGPIRTRVFEPAQGRITSRGVSADRSRCVSIIQRESRGSDGANKAAQSICTVNLCVRITWDLHYSRPLVTAYSSASLTPSPMSIDANIGNITNIVAAKNKKAMSKRPVTCKIEPRINEPRNVVSEPTRIESEAMEPSKPYIVVNQRALNGRDIPLE